MTRTVSAPLWVVCVSLCLAAAHSRVGNVSQVPPSLSVTEGGEVSLTCTLWSTDANLTEITFNWIFGNTEISCALYKTESLQCHHSDPTLSISAHLLNTSSTLTITRATPNHSGIYRCQVTMIKPLPVQEFNGSGSVLRVRGYREMESTVSQSPSSLSVREGGTISLNCTLRTTDGLPERVNFTWIGPNSVVSCRLEANVSEGSWCVSAEPRFSITADLPSQSSIFRINQSTLKDAGTYRCHIVNLQSRRRYGNAFVVVIERASQLSPLAQYLLIATASVLLLVFLLACLVHIAVKRRNPGQARNTAPGHVARTQGDAVSDHQVLYAMVQVPDPSRPGQQGEEVAYASITLSDLRPPPGDGDRTEYAEVCR
ncbi:uncharacterized protein LOC144487438 [Mustelus asterias]